MSTAAAQSSMSEDSSRLIQRSEEATTTTAPPWKQIEVDVTCAICLECFSNGELGRKLPCGHLFHVDCIDPWLTERSVCCPIDSRAVVCEEEASKLKGEEKASAQTTFDIERDMDLIAALSIT